MPNTPRDLDTSVPDWVSDHPATVAVFQEFGIDDCRGGKSLANARGQQGIDPNVVLAKRLLCIDANQQVDNQP